MFQYAKVGFGVCWVVPQGDRIVYIATGLFTRNFGQMYLQQPIHPQNRFQGEIQEMHDGESCKLISMNTG